MIFKKPKIDVELTKSNQMSYLYLYPLGTQFKKVYPKILFPMALDYPCGP